MNIDTPKGFCELFDYFLIALAVVLYGGLFIWAAVTNWAVVVSYLI